MLAIFAFCLLILLIILSIFTFTKRNKGEEGKEYFEEIKEENFDKPGNDLVINGEGTIITDKPSGKSSKVTLFNLTSGKHISTVIPEGESKVFGRLDKNNPNSGVIFITEDDKTISRNQFMISNEGRKLLIKDLGTKNGTFLNGQKIEGEVVLQNGSRIRIGDITGEREYNITIG